MKDKLIKVLVIEEEPGIAIQLLKQLESTKGYELLIDHTETLFEAIRLLKTQRYDVIITDLVLPDSWGIETFTRIKENLDSRDMHTPILILSEEEDTEGEKIVYEEGACDFLIKSKLTLELLSCAVCYAHKLKQVQDSLQESESRFERLVQAAQDIIFITNINGNITFVNRAFEKILGRKKEDAIGSRLIDYVLPDDRQSFNSSIIQQMRTDEFCITFEVRLETTSKEIKYIIFNCSPLKNNKGNVIGITGIGHDVSQMKSMEQELINKNRELNDFAYMVSHDLKNPIILIKSFLETVKNDPQSLNDYYQMIMDQSNRLIDFIDQLLKLSRAGKIIEDKIKINLDVLIKKIFVVQKIEDVETNLEINSPLPQVKGDPVKLEQVFSNLVQNSFRYRDKAKNTLDIEVGYETHDLDVIITFKDNGVGVDKYYMDKIFNAGFALKKDKGTGFGLAISKKIIEAHGGSIWAESEGKNKGIKFFIKLPR